jgi:hypothetical protein
MRLILSKKRELEKVDGMFGNVEFVLMVVIDI